MSSDNPVPFGMESALTGVVASIAMQETALSNLINMESRKISVISRMDYTSAEEKANAMLKANESVNNMVRSACGLEGILAQKLAISLRASVALKCEK